MTHTPPTPHTKRAARMLRPGDVISSWRHNYEPLEVKSAAPDKLLKGHTKIVLEQNKTMRIHEDALVCIQRLGWESLALELVKTVAESDEDPANFALALVTRFMNHPDEQTESDVMNHLDTTAHRLEQYLKGRYPNAE